MNRAVMARFDNRLRAIWHIGPLVGPPWPDSGRAGRELPEVRALPAVLGASVIERWGVRRARLAAIALSMADSHVSVRRRFAIQTSDRDQAIGRR